MDFNTGKSKKKKKIRRLEMGVLFCSTITDTFIALCLDA